MHIIRPGYYSTDSYSLSEKVSKSEVLVIKFYPFSVESPEISISQFSARVFKKELHL